MCIAVVLAAWGSAGTKARGETCVTQAQLPAQDRDALANVARKMTADVQAGDAGALRANSTPDLQRDFAGVAEAVSGLRDAQHATVTVRNMYLLDNSTAQPSDVMAQFFCGAFNTPQHVTFTLPGLKAARYAVVVVHLTGTESPRQISYVLQDINGWKLAGFIARPLMQGGHDGQWYWQRARELVQKHELWNATLCFQIAKQLLTPVGFLSSANLEKLVSEQQSAQPVDWPTEEKPLLLTVEGKPVQVTEVLPLIAAHNTPDMAVVVKYRQENGTDAVAVRAGDQAVAKELVRKFPELKELFTLMVVTYLPAGNVPVDGSGQGSVISLKTI